MDILFIYRGTLTVPVANREKYSCESRKQNVQTFDICIIKKGACVCVCVRG